MFIPSQNLRDSKTYGEDVAYTAALTGHDAFTLVHVLTLLKLTWVVRLQAHHRLCRPTPHADEFAGTHHG